MTEAAIETKPSSPLLGVLSLVFALLASLSVAMIGVTSFTSFNPLGWVRIASMAPMPFLLMASIGCGVIGIGKAATRGWSIGGLVLDAASIVAFVVMISLGS